MSWEFSEKESIEDKPKEGITTEKEKHEESTPIEHHPYPTKKKYDHQAKGEMNPFARKLSNIYLGSKIEETKPISRINYHKIFPLVLSFGIIYYITTKSGFPNEGWIYSFILWIPVGAWYAIIGYIIITNNLLRVFR